MCILWSVSLTIFHSNQQCFSFVLQLGDKRGCAQPSQPLSS
jgi:hypothetical protein